MMHTTLTVADTITSTWWSLIDVAPSVLKGWLGCVMQSPSMWEIQTTMLEPVSMRVSKDQAWGDSFWILYINGNVLQGSILFKDIKTDDSHQLTNIWNRAPLKLRLTCSANKVELG